MHEAKQHEHNCFLTLTYNNENLPKDMSLQPQHMTKFWKRLRKKYGNNIRYYYCGEYGERTGRPHYHACVFGFDFEDKKLWKMSQENALYRSESLEKLWPYGFSSIGLVTFESAAYVARYILKKRTGDAAEEHYNYVDSDGVIYSRMPEYTRMSRRPGIGKGWIEAYKGDVYPHDFVVIKGNKYRPPRYYDEQLEEEVKAELKAKRRRNAEKHVENNTPERRKVREQVHCEKVRRLVKPLGKEEL